MSGLKSKKRVISIEIDEMPSSKKKSVSLNKKEVHIEIDRLTNSIVNAISGAVFDTEFRKVSKKEIKKNDWFFNWHLELKSGKSEVYKMTIKDNDDIIQGLISLVIDDKFVLVNLAESAKFNQGKKKIYEGVGGNLFAFACMRSFEIGFDGFTAFEAKTALINHYEKTLGAQLVRGQRMFIEYKAAHDLTSRYFKNK